MQVTVYRSSVKDGMYVYLGTETSLDTLPTPVLKQLGAPEKALEFDLDENRQLPNADTKEVLEQIDSQGFYIQMPADIDVEAILARVSSQSTPQKK